MPESWGMVIIGGPEFEAACLASALELIPEMEAGIVAGSALVVADASQRTPVVSGELAGSWFAKPAAGGAEFGSSAPYGAGAEWGQQGKWAGFEAYGAPGERFVGAAAQDRIGEVADAATAMMLPSLTLHGWATPIGGI